jgi:hypothetical protein
LGDRGGQRDDQHDDKHRDEENSSPPRVGIHWYYCAWETTLLFNNQQATAFQPSQLGAGIRANKMSVPGVGISYSVVEFTRDMVASYASSVIVGAHTYQQSFSSNRLVAIL